MDKVVLFVLMFWNGEYTVTAPGYGPVDQPDLYTCIERATNVNIYLTLVTELPEYRKVYCTSDEAMQKELNRLNSE